MFKVILGLLFFSCLISISGCQTIKNTAAGITGGTKATVRGFGKGMAEDAGNTWKAINKADDWFRENCW